MLTFAAPVGRIADTSGRGRGGPSVYVGPLTGVGGAELLRRSRPPAGGRQCARRVSREDHCQRSLAQPVRERGHGDGAAPPPKLHRAPHGQRRRAPGRPRAARRAGAPVGAEAAIIPEHGQLWPTWLGLAVVSRRDDASPGDPATYALRLEAEDGSVSFAGPPEVAEAETGVSSHALPSDEPPRLGAWQKVSNADSISSAGCSGVDGGLQPVATACGGHGTSWNCPSHAIERDAAGHPACRLVVTTRLPACNPARGWSDAPDPGSQSEAPTSSPTWGLPRTCAVRLLDGADAEACATNSTCEGCASGWCMVASTFHDTACVEDASRAFPFRIVGGAFSEIDRYDITCDLEP